MSTHHLKDISKLIRQHEPTTGLYNANLSKEKLDQFVQKRNLKFKVITNNDALFYYNQIVQYWESHSELSNLDRKLLRMLPMILVLNFESRNPLYTFQGLLSKYLQIIKDDRSGRFIRKAMLAVFRHYRKYGTLRKEVFGALRSGIERSQSITLKRYLEIDSLIPFFNHELHVHLSNAFLKPEIIGNEVNSIADVFRYFGINENLLSDELGEEVFKSILTLNKANLISRDFSKIGTVFNVLQNDDTKGNKQLVCKNIFPEIAESFLVPFIDQDPPEEFKKRIDEFLTHHFGDPRGDARWNSVDSEAKKVLMRWKVGVTLGAFFKLLDYVAANDKQHDRHWEARRNFWNSYLVKGEILEAWIILGPKYLPIAKKILDQNLTFATFVSASGISSSHSAIIMRIRDKILVEWSHSGALRIWSQNSGRKPTFYEKQYDPKSMKLGYEDARVNNYEFISHSGNWESEVCHKLTPEFIYDNDKLITREEFRQRRIKR